LVKGSYLRPEKQYHGGTSFKLPTTPSIAKKDIFLISFNNDT
jgi:hypothetical protein